MEMTMDISIRLFKVHEGIEAHLVIARDEAQARAIAFGNRTADPEDWAKPGNEWRVEPLSDAVAATLTISDEDGEPYGFASLCLLDCRSRGTTDYLGNTVRGD